MKLTKYYHPNRYIPVAIMKDLIAITKGMDTYIQRHGGYTKVAERLHQMSRALYGKYVYYNKSGKHSTTERESYMKFPLP